MVGLLEPLPADSGWVACSIITIATPTEYQGRRRAQNIVILRPPCACPRQNVPLARSCSFWATNCQPFSRSGDPLPAQRQKKPGPR
jgi:hypothetical protein